MTTKQDRSGTLSTFQKRTNDLSKKKKFCSSSKLLAVMPTKINIWTDITRMLLKKIAKQLLFICRIPKLAFNSKIGFGSIKSCTNWRTKFRWKQSFIVFLWGHCFVYWFICCFFPHFRRWNKLNYLRQTLL